jgi:hypothetical protein
LESDAAAPEVYEASAIALSGLAPLLERAQSELNRLSYTKKLERDRMRYVLAAVSRKIEQRANRNVSDIWDRALLIKKKKLAPSKYFDIEHVMPQDAKYTSLGDDPDTTWIDSIGNLVLMDYSDNRGAGNLPPFEKLSHYASSELLLTRSICDIQDLGQLNDRIRRSLESIWKNGETPLTNWDKSCVAARANLYWGILSEEFKETLKIETQD